MIVLSKHVLPCLVNHLPRSKLKSCKDWSLKSYKNIKDWKLTFGIQVSQSSFSCGTFLKNVLLIQGLVSEAATGGVL